MGGGRECSNDKGDRDSTEDSDEAGYKSVIAYCKDRRKGETKPKGVNER